MALVLLLQEIPMFLNRAELFDLVWPQPRTALAARFKVSDVAVGKKGRSANIPMPAPGYWARLAAGAKPERPTLPLRLPGQAEMNHPGFHGGRLV